MTTPTEKQYLQKSFSHATYFAGVEAGRISFKCEHDSSGFALKFGDISADVLTRSAMTCRYKTADVFWGFINQYSTDFGGDEGVILAVFSKGKDELIVVEFTRTSRFTALQYREYTITVEKSLMSITGSTRIGIKLYKPIPDSFDDAYLDCDITINNFPAPSVQYYLPKEAVCGMMDKHVFGWFKADDSLIDLVLPPEGSYNQLQCSIDRSTPVLCMEVDKRFKFRGFYKRRAVLSHSFAVFDTPADIRLYVHINRMSVAQVSEGGVLDAGISLAEVFTDLEANTRPRWSLPNDRLLTTKIYINEEGKLCGKMSGKTEEENYWVYNNETNEWEMANV